MRSSCAGAGRNHSAGFTLLELMISLTIGLLIVGAMLAVVLSSTSTANTRERASELQTNARFAIDIMKRDIQHAGFLGGTSVLYPDAATTIPVANVCDATAIGRITLKVWGANDANPYAATCIPAGNYLRGDVLVVRRLAMSATTGALAGDRIYYRSAYEGGEFYKGPVPPDFSGTNRQPPYTDYALEETVYYISPYTTSPTESPRIPALYRMRLGAGPAMAAELVASGVENMQVRFGRFDAAAGAQYMDAGAVTAWDEISSVQVSLLMRGTAAEPGYQNTTTYELGDQRVTASDGFRRLLYASVVQLRN
jgi:type IV pilus assembly protein PilW